MNMCPIAEMPLVDLGELVDIVSGFAFKSAKFNDSGEGLPLVRIRDVVRGYSDTFYSGEFDDKYIVADGDYLIGMDGEFNLAKWNGGKALLNQRVCKIGAVDQKLDRHYLSRFLPKALKDIEDTTPFVTVKHLSVKKIREIPIPLPPLAEQKRIAGILDAADALRAKRRESLAQLDTLLLSTFLDTFGDPVTNPMEFPVRTLSEFYINKRDGTKCGPFGSALKKSELVDSGVPVWNMDNITPSGRMALPFRMWITEAKYRQLEAYSVIDGDVIISRAGTVGKMCVADSGCKSSIISTNLIRVRFGPDLLPIYFVSLMNYCKGRVGRLKTGPDGAFTHMSTGVLDKLNFPYPPLDLQHGFAAFVESAEQQKARLRAHLIELDTLFASLQSRAFRGEL
ncbi:MAG: restriction endonuclease subunit S [Pseudomonadales bacterium]|nr:restriction endonuclease subunit S [Pseudomonadales bacterium]